MFKKSVLLVPTLGEDSIAAGKRAALIGGGAVVIAILLYYGPLFGLVLTIGLGISYTLCFRCFSWFGTLFLLCQA